MNGSLADCLRLKVSTGAGREITAAAAAYLSDQSTDRQLGPMEVWGSGARAPSTSNNE